jgi:hypothetical protein
MDLLRRVLHRPTRRGQALVEFAIILPLLALLLVMAIDFGRVFFGWVALHNTARIGADWAAQTADSWPSTSDPGSEQNRLDYQTLMASDLAASNCEYVTPLPQPTFSDGDNPPDGETQDWGDLARVDLECQFGLITPLAENVLGGPVTIRATSTFMIHGTTVGSVPEAPPPPCEAPEAAIDHDPPLTAGNRININSGDLVVDFEDLTSDTTACPVTVRTWDFDDGSPIETADQVSHEFPPHVGGGNTEYSVLLTVQTAKGTDTATVKVRVTP